MKLAATVTVTEFARNLSRYIHRVAFGGERFILLKGGRPVAEILPPPRGRRLGELRQLLAELPHLPPEDAAAFASDLDAARATLGAIRTEDRWES
ncbi:MAG: type II toxin-antitoxin system Phd/YefM family antitoxin [Gammaproteobacteria bacterium]